MAQLAALPGDSWQHVVCRICAHPFDVAVENSEDVLVSLCQTCSILVDWFGEEETQTIPPPQPARIKKRQKQTSKAQKPEREQLASLLDRWGELWRTSEDEA
jgi:hypothetical protein